MNGSEMFAQFKSMEEMRSYCEAQYKTIVELSKKIQKLEDSKTHLEGLLATTAPLMEVTTDLIESIIPNEQIIAEVQLGILKSKALSGPSGTELTLEETKKVEIYSKVIASLKASQGKKPVDIHIKEVSNKDLLKAIEGSNGAT